MIDNRIQTQLQQSDWFSIMARWSWICITLRPVPLFHRISVRWGKLERSTDQARRLSVQLQWPSAHKLPPLSIAVTHCEDQCRRKTEELRCTIGEAVLQSKPLCNWVGATVFWCYCVCGVWPQQDRELVLWNAVARLQVSLSLLSNRGSVLRSVQSQCFSSSLRHCVTSIK